MYSLWHFMRILNNMVLRAMMCFKRYTVVVLLGTFISVRSLPHHILKSITSKMLVLFDPTSSTVGICPMKYLHKCAKMYKDVPGSTAYNTEKPENG